MADPLSIAASITAVLQLTSVVVQYIGDVKDSSKERLRIRDEISTTSFLLYTLRDRVNAARLQDSHPVIDLNPTVGSESLSNGSDSLALRPLVAQQYQGEGILALKRTAEESSDVRHAKKRNGVFVFNGGDKDQLPLDNSENRQWLFTVESLAAPRGPLDQFKDALDDLATRLAPLHGHRKIGQALKWKFEKEEVSRILDTIERQKSIFGLAIQNDHVALSDAIKADIKRIQSDVNDMTHSIDTLSHGVQNLQAYHDDIAEKKRIERLYSWVGAVDPTSNHEAACKKRHPMTGQWVIEGQKLERWKATPGSFLWINGIPGCGKTVLCSTIIESVLSLCTEGKSMHVAYFYFDFNDDQKQHPHSLVTSIIKQLAMVSALAEKLLEERHTRRSDGERKLDESAATELLHDILAALGQQSQIYIIIDALDECAEQEQLCTLLGTIHGWANSKANLLATSRPEKLIQDALNPLINHKISLRGDAVDADIQKYIQETLKTDAKLSKWPTHVKTEIEEELMSNADGMFRWAFCQLVELRKCLKLDKLRKALTTLPKTLDETYTRILRSIDEDYLEDACRILRWLAFSAAPLSIEALSEVVAINRGEFEPVNRLIEPREILTICTSLVTLSAKVETYPLTLQKVQLAHSSVKEYLISERVLAATDIAFDIWSNAHAILAEDCMAYLLHVIKANISETDALGYPLLGHAMDLWMTYSNFGDLRDETINLAGQLLLEHFDEYRKTFHTIRSTYGFSDPETPLIHAVSVGAARVVQVIINTGADVNYWFECANDHDKSPTALHAAASRGDIESMRLLIRYGANVNAQHGVDDSALQLAAFGGFTECVKLLLASGADPNLQHAGECGTALQAAAHGANSDGCIAALLKGGADPNLCRDNCDTPLRIAAGWGHSANLKMLLKGGAQPDIICGDVYSALAAAAHDDREECLQLLLEAGADPNLLDLRGMTALETAVRRGSYKCTELLLANGARPLSSPKRFPDALIQAVETKSDYCVNTLLKAGLDPNTLHAGISALFSAASSGSAECVEALLAAGARPTFGSERDALIVAILKGANDSAKLLFAAAKGCHLTPHYYESLLPIAIDARNLEVVKLLIEYGLSLKIPRRKDGTWSAASAMGESEEVAQLLWDAGAVVVVEHDARQTQGKYALPLESRLSNPFRKAWTGKNDP